MEIYLEWEDGVEDVWAADGRHVEQHAGADLGRRHAVVRDRLEAVLVDGPDARVPAGGEVEDGARLASDAGASLPVDQEGSLEYIQGDDPSYQDLGWVDKDLRSFP